MFLPNLFRALRFRVVQFLFFYLAVSLFLYAQEDTSGVTTLQDIYLLDVFTFAVTVFFINAAATCFVSSINFCYHIVHCSVECCSTLVVGVCVNVCCVDVSAPAGRIMHSFICWK